MSLARRQHGVVAAHQLLAAGLSPQQIHRLRRSPDWSDAGRGVLVRAGSHEGVGQRLAIAVLGVGPGAALSHESAAAWWGHRGCRLERPIHVVTDVRRARPAGPAKVHTVRRLDRRWVVVHDGVVVARPELVALQLFASMSCERAERVVDTMWSMRLLSGASLELFLREVGRRGRNGTAGLRRFHAARGADYRPPESGLETRVAKLLAEVGIRVRRQVDSGGQEHWSGRVDFRHAVAPLVLEVQSAIHHSSLTDRAADRRRHDLLRADGFEVVEVTDDEVWNDPGRVVAAVRRGLDRVRAGSGLGGGTSRGADIGRGDGTGVGSGTGAGNGVQGSPSSVPAGPRAS